MTAVTEVQLPMMRKVVCRERKRKSQKQSRVSQLEDLRSMIFGTNNGVAVHIDDGEAGEVSLLQFRAKLFALESKEAGWKERGVGTLKVNVPKACASFDDDGHPIPGSFDASGLEDEDADSKGPRVTRLIMRQENTHRVILNTILVPAMEFRDKPSASSAQILFTAFEGEKEPKPINLLLKASPLLLSTACI